MILPRLGEPPVLLDNFDPASVDRAIRGLVHAVHEVEVIASSAHRVSATARVHGSAAAPYRTHVEAFADTGWTEEVVVESRCTCPVGQQCKHGVALCLRLAQQPGEDTGHLDHLPDWQHALETLVGALAPMETASPGESVALRFTLRPGNAHAATTVDVRPMRPGRRGWVQTGLGWRDLGHVAATGRYDTVQVRALDDLQRSSDRSFWPGVHERGLRDFDPRLVALLRRARDAGVELYGAPPLTGVRVLAEAVTLTADLRRTGDGVVLDVGVDLGDGLVPATDLMLLGEPAHATATVDPAGVLRIAALAEPVARTAARALGLVARVEVPETELGVLDGYLRRLGTAVRVGSSDTSVALPAPVEPRLRVRVLWHDTAAASVRWTWVYSHGDDDLECGVDSTDRLGGLRDRDTERRLLDELGGPAGPGPDTTDRDVAGVDVVGLALLEIPAWRADDAVEVVERDRPDLRPARESPTVEFLLAEPVDPELEQGTDWLDLRVTVLIEGERVPLSDLLASLTREDPWLILPSGLLLATDLPEVTALAESVRAAAELRDPRRDDEVRVGRDDLATLAAISDLGSVDDQAAAWVERARALRDLEELPRPEVPTGIVAELRPYQRDGFAWLALLWERRLGGVLADDMGLGKTLQVLALIAHTRVRGAREPFLVVAPTSVVGAWVGEAVRHAPGLRVRAVTATATRRATSIADLAVDVDVVVTSYTLLRLEAADYAAVGWAGLVLDEAHQVKNHKSQVHRAVRPLRAPFRLAVTGTPFENRLTELWSLLAIVAPGLYPNRARFSRAVATPIEKGGDEAVLARLRRRIKPFLLRRTKELVAPDLPPKQEQQLAVELSSAHRAVYDAHLARERQRILGLLESFEENRVEILAALTRLRQLALDPGLVDPVHDRVGSTKLDLLLDHLTEVTAEGHRVLVFSSFTGYLARVRARLDDAGLDHVYLDGSTTDRASVIEGFRTGDAPVFLISLKAGGVGLTLTEADYVYVLDPWWNPAAEAQAVDRAHRIGQRSTVMVYRLVATGTIEDKVMELKARKAAVFAQVMDAGGAPAGEITAADIRALFE